MKAIAAILGEELSSTLKKEFYEAYKANGGYSYAAAKQVGVKYPTAHYWMANDPEFKELMDSVKGMMLDAAEAELYKRALRNSDRDACLLFYLKTKGRERGYIETKDYDRVDGIVNKVLAAEHEAAKALENKSE